METQKVELLQVLYQYLTPLNIMLFLVLMIGGKAWTNHFSVFKLKAHDFLLFSTITGVVWLTVKAIITKEITPQDWEGIIVTYVFTILVYPIAGKWIMTKINNIFKPKDNDSRK